MQTHKPGGRFSFAQISDPHLSDLRGVRTSDLLNKRLLGYLSWLKRRRAEHQRSILDAMVEDIGRIRPDHLIVTGDLTHIGLPEEFRQARDWLQGLGTPTNVTVVPGNHDTYTRARSDQTIDLWNAYMMSDRGTTQAGSIFPSLRIRGPAAIVGLSSALPTAPFLAMGSIGTAQLQALPHILEETARAGLFRILVIHHSPAEGVDKWRKHLTDRSQLQAVLARHGVELILHGHTHRAVWSILRTAAGEAPVICTTSASAVGHKAGRRAAYNLYRLETGAREWRLTVETRGCAVVDGRFHQTGQRELLIRRP